MKYTVIETYRVVKDGYITIKTNINSKSEAIELADLFNKERDALEQEITRQQSKRVETT
jgi:hypothetical protein